MSLQELRKRLAGGGGPAADPHAAGQERPTLVICDDDPMVRSSLEVMLSDTYVLRLCKNGDEALAAVDDDVDAVILDVRMPGKDGFAVYEEIRGKNDLVPIIFFSAHQDLKDPYTIMNSYRPFAYVFKGGDIQELLRTLSNAVKTYGWLRQLRKDHARVREMLSSNR